VCFLRQKVFEQPEQIFFIFVFLIHYLLTIKRKRAYFFFFLLLDAEQYRIGENGLNMIQR